MTLSCVAVDHRRVCRKSGSARRCFEVPACVETSATKFTVRQKPCTTVTVACAAKPAARHSRQTYWCAKRTSSSRQVKFWSRRFNRVLGNGVIFVSSADHRSIRRPTKDPITFRCGVAPWTMTRLCVQRSTSTPVQKHRGWRYVTGFLSSPGTPSGDAQQSTSGDREPAARAAGS